MRISLATRATRVCAAATLVTSLSLAPSSARMGGGPVGAHFARPAFGGGHFPHVAPRGFNPRFDFGRSGFNRFAPKRFDHFGFNRFGANGFNRFGAGHFGRNQLLIGGWGGWGWGGVPASAGASGAESSSATARRSSSMSGPIPLQAPPPRDTEELASSTSLFTTAAANMPASDKARSADRTSIRDGLPKSLTLGLPFCAESRWAVDSRLGRPRRRVRPSAPRAAPETSMDVGFIGLGQMGQAIALKPCQGGTSASSSTTAPAPRRRRWR